MRLEFYDPLDHTFLLKSWWESRQGIDFPIRLLSDLGYVAYEEGRAVAAAFLFTTNSKVALLGWPVSDPESSPELRDSALTKIYEELHLVAKDLGFELIWSTAGIPALQKRLLGLGYTVGDENINQYFKELE